MGEIIGAIESMNNLTERIQTEEAQRASLQFLEIVHKHTEIAPLLEEYVSVIKGYTGCDAVGIRVLDETRRIPYAACDGFSRQFIELESLLSLKSDECMCINVMRGDNDPKRPFYTQGGSFCVNAASRFLATVSEEEKGRTLNRCRLEGYETVALTPFRSGGKILGLIHVADHRENMAPPCVVETLEKAALLLGTAFEKVQAERRLRESEEHYRSLFEHMLNGYAYCRMHFDQGRPDDFTYLDVNRAFETLTGLKDVVGKRVSEVIPGIREANPEMFGAYGRVASTGIPERFETHVEALGIWFSISVYSPKKDHFVAVFEVITERKQAEEALRESELKYRNLIEHIPQRIFYKDRGSAYVSCNGLFARDLGVPEAGIAGRTDFDLFPRELAEKYRADDLRVMETGQDLEIEESYMEDGNLRTVLTRKTPVRDDQGEVRGVLGIFSDITRRKRAEDLIHTRLRLLEYAASHSLDELLQKTVDEVGLLTDSPIGFYHFVESDQKTLSLQAWSTQTVRKFCKAKGKGLHYDIDQAGVWVDCVHERKPVIHNDYSALPHRKGLPAGHAPVIRELVVPIVRSDRVVAILGIGNKPVDYNERDVEVVSYLADVAWEITRRKRAEAALKESEEFKNAILDSVSSNLAVLDRNGVILSVNEPWVRFSIENGGTEGVPIPGTGPGVNYLEVCRKSSGEGSEEAMAAHDGIRAVLDGSLPSFAVEYPCHSPDTQRWLTLTVTPLGTGRNGVVVSHTDITERKLAELERHRMEAQLRQAQKMEALGTLAGGIAHDFNNILGIIVGYTEMAGWDVGRESRAQSDLREVLKAAQRAKELVQQILAFSRRNEQERYPVRVGLMVKEALKMLRASIPSTIEIKANVASDASVLGDPTQFHQVLMNLCTNAAHAMRDKGGFLEVGLDNAQLGPECLKRHPGLIPGPFVRLTVKDTGHGIDPGILHRIFDPFFTTKGPGEGTGLGLSVVHGIVKSYGGAIEVESFPGSGTTFQVLFPAIEDARAPERHEIGSFPRGRERVLVVDDEPALTVAVKKMLERLGYEVEYRANGIEALEAFRRSAQHKSFDLVITDMTMPHMTGAELAGELRRIQPGLPVLLCTGFSERMDAERAASIGIEWLLMKPIDLGELAVAIRRALDKKAG